MRVLSIDWDYFVDATATQRAMLFPDGGNENIAPALQNVIWTGRYMPHNASDMPQLAEIGYRREDYTLLRMLLKRSIDPKTTKVVIADSHRHAYEAVVSAYEQRHINNLHTERIELINIDHHHDCYFSHEEGREVDCGNWLYKLIEKYGSRLQATWVHNPDSDPWDEGSLNECELTDIDASKTFDVVFLCRSAMWSPPHLDKYFTSLARWLFKYVEDAYMPENWVTANRYNAGFKGAIQVSQQTKLQMIAIMEEQAKKYNLTAPPLYPASEVEALMGGEQHE